MKTTRKRLLCLILSLLMILSCVPTVGAEDKVSIQDDTEDLRISKAAAAMRDGEASEFAYNEDTIYYGKNVTLAEDGTYTIALNSFVTGDVTPQPVPLDIVLVMDQSTSMTSNAMNETPESVRFMTNVKGYTYNHLMKQPWVWYLVDSTYHAVTIQKTSTGSSSAVVMLGGQETAASSYSQKFTSASSYNVTLNGWYHDSSKAVRFKLYTDSEKGHYYYSADTGGRIGYWDTAEEAMEYMKTTYRAENYSDYRAVTFTTSSGSTHTDITYCLPVYFKWSGTKYTLFYVRNDTTQTVVDTCEPWYSDVPSPSEDSAQCNLDDVYIYSRNDALQEAAYDFVRNMQQLSFDQGVNHRLAVVGFGCGADSTYPDGSNEGAGAAFLGTELLSTAENVNYADADENDYREALQNALSGENIRNMHLLTAIERIDGKGRTYPNYGLELAQKILNARTETTYKVGNRELPRKTIVILFTDGLPAYESVQFANNELCEHFANIHACGTIPTANKTIAEAKKLKDAGAAVYSIGMLDGIDPAASINFTETTCTHNNGSYPCYTEKATAINAFLHFLSSDYPDAESMLGPNRSTVINNGYFFAANTANALDQAFNNIYENAAIPTVALTADAVMRDVMAEGFDLPADIEDNPRKYIATATLDYLGEEKWGPIVQTTEFPITVNAATKTVDVTGFDYESNYVHEAYTDTAGNLIPAGGKRLLIVIFGVTANDEALQNGLVNTNDGSSGIYVNGDLAAELVVAYNMPTEQLEKKSFVLDYFMSAEIDPEEVGVYTPLHLSKDGMTYFTEANTSLDCANGTIAIVDGKLQYTPTTADFHTVDSFYLFGKDANGENVWAKLNILPANNVFYEDDWVSYSENWSVVGTPNNNTETFNGPIHGYIDSKANESGYSNGSAHFSDYEYATAEFTFTGTGIDIYCRTDSECGVALAVLNSTGETVTSQHLIMDVLSTSGTYYQIPALFFHDLTYDTYTLKITIKNATYGGGRDDFYIDGFRVYSPLETEDELVADAYGNETGASYATLRDLLISASETAGVIEGAVFIDDANEDSDVNTPDDNSSSIQDYIDYGPKNEIYLAPGNSIILKVKSATHYYLGIKSPSGSAKVSYSYGTNANGEDLRNEAIVNSAADLYYKVIPSAEGYIEIKNISETGLIALTKLRACSGTAEDLTLRSATVDEILAYANRFDSLAQAETLTIGAPTFTKAPKQPKPIFRNIKKPILGREQR